SPHRNQAMKYKEIYNFRRKINFYKELCERPDKLGFALYRFKWNFYPRFHLVPRFPLHVDIEVTDACNLRCIMCVHGTGTKIETGSMDPDFAKEMIRQSADGGAYSLKFNWRGEPALYRHLPQLIRFAKENGIREVQLNTNGLPFTPGTISEYLDSGLDRIIISVDGNSKETYEKIRIGGDFNRLVRNIESFVQQKRDRMQSKPFVRVQLVRMQENLFEIEDFRRRWEKRVDDIRISDVTDRGQRANSGL
ncbi:unnamed protein product, partial [marine sediment metagenome]